MHKNDPEYGLISTTPKPEWERFNLYKTISDKYSLLQIYNFY